MATQCWMAGRIEAAVRYSDEAQQVLDSGRSMVPFGIEGLIGVTYTYIGQPAERWVEWCRARLARGRDTHINTRTALIVALDRSYCAENDEPPVELGVRCLWVVCFGYGG